jgi:hypothetical protein
MATKPPVTTKRTYAKRTTRQEQAIIATLPADFPRLPIVPEARCKLCQLFNTHPELFHQVNRGIVSGTLRSELVDLCADQGVKTSTNSLNRHKDHIMDFVGPAVATHLELEIISRQVGTIQDGNMAVIITKLLSLAILPSLREIASNIKSQDAKIAGRAEKAVRLALEIARTSSAVQTADATTRLRAAELQDKLNRLGAAQRARIELAIDEMRVEMQQRHPEIWERISPLLEEFVAVIGSEDTVEPVAQVTITTDEGGD